MSSAGCCVWNNYSLNGVMSTRHELERTLRRYERLPQYTSFVSQIIESIHFVRQFESDLTNYHYRNIDTKYMKDNYDLKRLSDQFNKVRQIYNYDDRLRESNT